MRAVSVNRASSVERRKMCGSNGLGANIFSACKLRSHISTPYFPAGLSRRRDVGNDKPERPSYGSWFAIRERTDRVPMFATVYGSMYCHLLDHRKDFSALLVRESLFFSAEPRVQRARTIGTPRRQVRFDCGLAAPRLGNFKMKEPER